MSSKYTHTHSVTERVEGDRKNNAHRYIKTKANQTTES